MLGARARGARPAEVVAGQRELLVRLQAVVEAKDAENAVLRPELDAERELRRRSSRYWLRAAAIGEDVIGGRVSLAAEDGERRNFHRSARAPPAAR